jgi:hypothetical protein
VICIAGEEGEGPHPGADQRRGGKCPHARREAPSAPIRGEPERFVKVIGLDRQSDAPAKRLAKRYRGNGKIGESVTFVFITDVMVEAESDPAANSAFEPLARRAASWRLLRMTLRRSGARCTRGVPGDKVPRFAPAGPIKASCSKGRRMGPDSFIVFLATAAVALVLLLGLANMLRGGSPNRSQNLMRLRVVLQAVAIVLIVLVLWWRGH